MKLTAKQEKFCQEFIRLGNASAAYRAAYDCTNKSAKSVWELAAQMMRNVKVSSRIAELRKPVIEMAEKELKIDKAWVLAELVDNVKRAKASEPVTDEQGNPIGEYKQNLTAANKALELIGKEFGMFVDRKEIRTGPLEGLSDEELLRRADHLAKELGVPNPLHGSRTH
jgi:phage terminase small subunit